MGTECTVSHRLRPGVEGDRRFVTRAWVSEMRGSAFSRHVPQHFYWPCQHELVRQVLDSMETIVAVDPDDENHLYGCIVHQPGDTAVVHWLYVKGDYRRFGLGRALLEAAIGERRPILFTQAPPLCNDRALVEKFGALYCPYLLLGIAPPILEPNKTMEAANG